jgi:hypothetical protein
MNDDWLDLVEGRCCGRSRDRSHRSLQLQRTSPRSNSSALATKRRRGDATLPWPGFARGSLGPKPVMPQSFQHRLPAPRSSRHRRRVRAAPRLASGRAVDGNVCRPRTSPMTVPRHSSRLDR